MVDLPVISSALSIIDKILKLFRTPRSKIRIEQLTDDALAIDANTRPDWVILNWNLTAINDGRRDGQLASPVFENAKFSSEAREVPVTPDDIGKGTVRVRFREKEESTVERLSNDKITIEHELSKNEGIHEYISEYDTMEFKYSILIEDGSLPYKIEAEGWEDISGITLRWNRD